MSQGTHRAPPIRVQTASSGEELRRTLTRMCSDMNAMSLATQEVIAKSRIAIAKADAALRLRKTKYDA